MSKIVKKDEGASFWGWTTLESDRTLECHVGSVTFWLRYEHRDWYLARKWDSGDITAPSASARAASRDGIASKRSVKKAPDDVAWQRWTAEEDSLSVKFLPVLPDRPIIVRPEIDVTIPAGKGARFFVGLPIWVRVEVGTRDPITLADIPSVVLSNSWFGDATAGELCYALRTRATRQLDPALYGASHAVCCVDIENQSGAPLAFQRHCLHSEFLNLYRADRLLYTNQVNVAYRGDEQLSKVDFDKKTPQFEPGMTLLQKARKIPDESLLRKTFLVIRSLTGT